MSLLDNIKKDRVLARKGTSCLDKVRATLLTTLVGEAETALKGKQASKFDMVTLVKKFYSNCKETLEIKESETLRLELKILSNYIPEQLTEEEIVRIISEQKLSDQKELFAFLTQNYKGQYEGKVASQAARKEFTK